MQKILVIGSLGAGKSTFCIQLQECTGLPLYHLDSMFWRPDWQPADMKQFQREVAELVQKETWIIDGNYSSTLAVRAKQADTIIFLDYSRYLCIWRACKRVFGYHVLRRARPDTIKGCPEQMDWEFFMWIWSFPTKHRAKSLDAINLGGFPSDKINIFKNSRESQVFLNELCAR